MKLVPQYCNSFLFLSLSIDTAASDDFFDSFVLQFSWSDCKNYLYPAFKINNNAVFIGVNWLILA